MTNEIDKCTIILELSEYAVKYTIPIRWSVNKVKCLVAQQIPKLTFDEFELVHCDRLLSGSDRLADIVSEQNNSTVTLRLEKMEGKIKLQEYYGETMNQFISLTDCEHHPLLCGQYRKAVSFMKQQKDDENERGNEQEIEEILADVGDPWHIILLRFMGLLMLTSILRVHGSAIQILIICAIVLFYYYIELYRVRNARALRNINGQDNLERRHNNNQRRNSAESQQEEQGQQPRDKTAVNIKGQVVFEMFKLLQIIYTFTISLFPNWNIRFHLHQNADYLKKAKAIINSYRPETYSISNDRTGTTKARQQ